MYIFIKISLIFIYPLICIKSIILPFLVFFFFLLASRECIFVLWVPIREHWDLGNTGIGNIGTGNTDGEHRDLNQLGTGEHLVEPLGSIARTIVYL